MGITKKGADPSRQERKAKKRKLEDAIPDLPGDNEIEAAEGEGPEKVEKRKSKKLKTEEFDGMDEEKNEKKKEKKEKKSKKSEIVEENTEEPKSAKKEKKSKSVEVAQEGGEIEEKVSKKEKKSKAGKEQNGEVETADDVMAGLQGEKADAPKKSKKERKAERKAKDAAAKPAPVPVSTEVGIAAEDDEKAAQPPRKNNNRNRDRKRQEKAAAKDGTEKPDRFIVFAGNIPFSATTQNITAHFASIKPKSIRHLTQKDDPTKSKGMAFIEFDGYDSMQTCLKLFHHSVFDDKISPPRKINVELTVGGGGNKKGRMSKIQDKNGKLSDERTRRAIAEEKAKFEKKKEGGAVDESGIHPSRKARVPGSS